MKYLLVSLFIASLCVSGCAVAPPLATSSGRPEVTIQTAHVAKFRAMVIGAVVSHGGELVVDTPSLLKVRGDMTGAGAFAYQALLGNAHSTQPKEAFVFTFVPMGSTTKIFVNAKVDMQNAFGGDQGSDFTAARGAKLQEMLEGAKAKVGG